MMSIINWLTVPTGSNGDGACAVITPAIPTRR